MKRTPLLLAAWLLSAGLASAQLRELKKTFARPEYVLVASHRALHNEHPENSLPAFRAAVDAGIDIIETDVKVTKDGVPVLMHDRTINRTTTGTGDPENYTLAELKQFYLRSGARYLRKDPYPRRSAEDYQRQGICGPRHQNRQDRACTGRDPEDGDQWRGILFRRRFSDADEDRQGRQKAYDHAEGAIPMPALILR